MMKHIENGITNGVKGIFDKTAAGGSYAIIGGGECEDIEALEFICSRPAFQPLLREIHLRITDKIAVPFRTLDGNTIELHRNILTMPALAELHMRHALELAMWFRLVRGQRDIVFRLVCAVLACRTALAYYEIMTEHEREVAYRGMPRWMKAAFAEANYHCDDDAFAKRIAKSIGRFWNQLLSLQGVDPSSFEMHTNEREVFERVYESAEKATPLALPVERILMMGGDNRLFIDSRTGLNKYGCSPRPRPWAITFATCTSSSISDVAYREAECFRQSLLAQAMNSGKTISENIANEFKRIRTELVCLLKLNQLSGAEVVLTPSGTDGELYALYFALHDNEQGLTNILIAPTEVGSGVVSAAGGLHFDSETPLGVCVEPGTLVEGLPAKRVRVECLQVRDECGEPVPIVEIDRRLESLVSQAVGLGNAVLVHLLDSSKTGLGAPSIETIRRLKQEYGSSVYVVVDAAQMRLENDALIDYLRSGFMVLVTGSKFFTGPPFSGALLVPPNVARKVEHLPPLPAGFANYGTRSDFPLRWPHLIAGLRDYPNVGLLFRWHCALMEMKAFYAVSADERYATIHKFGQAVVNAIRRNPDVELAAAPARERRETGESTRWDHIPTIFSFFVNKKVMGTDSISPMTYDEAVRAYRWLNLDIAQFLPEHPTERESRVAAKQCHIGQPVRIRQKQDQWTAALRIATGARLVSRIAFDRSLGGTAKERLAAQINDAELVLEKLSVIVRYWEELNSCNIDGVTT